jgi:hypothetical protein
MFAAENENFHYERWPCYIYTDLYCVIYYSAPYVGTCVILSSLPSCLPLLLLYRVPGHFTWNGIQFWPQRLSLCSFSKFWLGTPLLNCVSTVVFRSMLRDLPSVHQKAWLCFTWLSFQLYCA